MFGSIMFMKRNAIFSASACAAFAVIVGGLTPASAKADGPGVPIPACIDPCVYNWSSTSPFSKYSLWCETHHSPFNFEKWTKTKAKYTCNNGVTFRCTVEQFTSDCTTSTDVPACPDNTCTW